MGLTDLRLLDPFIVHYGMQRFWVEYLNQTKLYRQKHGEDDGDDSVEWREPVICSEATELGSYSLQQAKKQGSAMAENTTLLLHSFTLPY